jgi:cell division FtsZ-interacting protein ZapD
LTVANEDLFLRVETICTKFVNVLCFQESARRKKFLRTSSELLKDISGTLSAPCS